MTKAPSRAQTDRLLSSIYEAPSDDERRAVYADALQALGDPRGEYIALSLAAPSDPAAERAKHRRIRRLLRDHEDDWLRPFGGKRLCKTVVWRGGFVDELAATYRTREAARAFCKDHAWSTVRAVTFPRHGLLAPHMSGLESIGAIPHDGLGSLRAHRYARLSSMVIAELAPSGGPTLSGGKPVSKSLEAFAAAHDALPALRTLGLRFATHEERSGAWLARGPSDFAWLLDAPIGRRLDALSVHVTTNEAAPSPIVQWLHFFRAFSGALRRLELVAPVGRLELERDSGRITASSHVQLARAPSSGGWGDVAHDPFEDALWGQAVDWVAVREKPG